MGTWKLPKGIDEITGDQALAFESIRRQVMDLYIDKGFELIIPPMVSYADNVNEKCFKFLDSVSDKMLSVNADITPQIARIDNQYNSTDIKKYCYINAVLKPKADDFYASRSPIQAGAELYGVEDISANIEMIQLMLDSLKLLSIQPIVLSLGNVAIFNALIKQTSLNNEKIAALKDIFVRRSIPDLKLFLSDNILNNADKFSALIQLEGNAKILTQALDIFNDMPEAISAIKDLIKIDKHISTQELEIVYDLAMLKTYEYHTGIVFCAYHQDYSKALAQGGSYQGTTQRVATGFSFDLKFLSQSKTIL